jgi:preprotein translocase subunit YajC
MNRFFSLVFIAITTSSIASAEAGMGGARDGVTPLIPLVIIFGIFYFLIIRPQQKKAKLHQQFLTELKRGDMVVTASGIIGTIKNLSDRFVTLEVDNGVCMKIVRNQVLENANSLKEESGVKDTVLKKT